MTELSREDSASLVEALRRALQEQYAFADARQQEIANGPGHMPPVFSLLSGLGLNGLMLPESHGGFSGGLEDLQRVQSELGRALVMAPWFDSVLAAQAILMAGTPEQQSELLPALTAGELAVALALNEDPTTKATRAIRGDSGWRLQGAKSCVFHAGAVDRLLVSASLEQGGIALFLVPVEQAGVRQSSYRLVDSSWSAELVFEGAEAELLGPTDTPDQSATIRSLELMAGAGRYAEAFGAAEAALELSVQYLGTRHQFGQALGEYQALRHRVAEMYISLEQTRSAMELAVEAFQSADPADADRRLAQAQLVSSESATWVLQQAIQLHGGMGMTEELAVGHYYRRMLVLNALSGGAPEALARLTRTACAEA